MKPEAIKEYYIQNGGVVPTEKDEVFEMITKPPIYEVIRVIDGVPLFLEDHLDRMFESAKLIDYDLGRDEKQIREDIKKLIYKNKIKKSNIKLLSTNIEGQGKIFLVYSIASFYPPEEYYNQGIDTILFKHERQNPNAKVLFTSFKDEVTKQLDESKAFEALLVNEKGYIPEGSRSNMFFVKENKVYTAPESEILMGITRKHIFNACEKLNIDIVEKSIHIEDIKNLDGGFMSGTSVNVLPISKIDNTEINSVKNKIIREINNAYVLEMENYIIKYMDDWI